MKNTQKNIASTVKELISPVVSELGYDLWDVEYIKEGAAWYLRITIDNEIGININDCETVHRAIDLILDKVDPIEDPYQLEVSSPGIERELRIEKHFLACIGQTIQIKLYTAIDGTKALIGKLVSFNMENGENVITIVDENNGGKQYKIKFSMAAIVKTVFDFKSNKE